MQNNEDQDDRFSARYIDLLDERVGGQALTCSDEWFAECANLVKHAAPVFRQGHFVPTGQWMDGWESRRSFGRACREGGLDYDWCLVRLGIGGSIRGLDINTRHFRGNAPEFASVVAANVIGEIDEHTEWVEILQKSPLSAHCQNLFEISSKQVWTHLRLKIYPDGGVARLRVYGEARASRNHFVEGELLDLASVMNGGRSLACSDMFYSSPNHLLMPGRGVNMGDGWETRRRRDDGNDWCIIGLGVPGSIRKVLFDTAHFKGNFPDSFMLEAANTTREDVSAGAIPWHTVIPRTSLQADQEHLYIRQIAVAKDRVFTHVRLHIYPDGGVSRLRVFGLPDWPKP